VRVSDHHHTSIVLNSDKKKRAETRAHGPCPSLRILKRRESAGVRVCVSVGGGASPTQAKNQGAIHA
jgi:hypothetical protein